MTPFSLLPPWARIAILLGLAALSFSGGFYTGWRWRNGDYQKHLKQDAERSARLTAKIRDLESDAVIIAQKIRETNDRREAEVRVVFRTIIRKVPEYVTNTAASRALDAAGGLPMGFVQLHNAAALGVDPDTTPAAGSFRPDAPSGLGLPDASSAISGNYQLYHECRGRLVAWDDWYARLTAAYEAAKKTEN